MTAADFRRIALSFDGAEEGSHMGAVDFRVGGRIFATLALVEHGFGNLMLTPEVQTEFVSDAGSAHLLSRRYRSTARRAASARDIPGARVISLSRSRSAWRSSPRQIRRSSFSAAYLRPRRATQSHIAPATAASRISGNDSNGSLLPRSAC
jgi:hypothetical protein